MRLSGGLFLSMRQTTSPNLADSLEAATRRKRDISAEGDGATFAIHLADSVAATRKLVLAIHRLIDNLEAQGVQSPVATGGCE